MHNVNAIDSQVLDVMLRAGSSWVLYLLLGLSVAAVAVMFERIWFFARERRPRQALDEALAAVAKGGTLEALVATGIGLIVALPAVATYNIFTRHVERATSAAEMIAHEILARLKTEPGPAAPLTAEDA